MKPRFQLTATVSYFGRWYRAEVSDVGPTRATVHFKTKGGRPIDARLPYAPLAPGRANVLCLRGPFNTSVHFSSGDDRHPACAHFTGGQYGGHSVRLDRRDGDRLAIHLDGYIENNAPASFA